MIDSKILYVLRPVNCEGSYPGETKCIPTTSKILNHYLPGKTHSTVEDLEQKEENEIE